MSSILAKLGLEKVDPGEERDPAEATAQPSRPDRKRYLGPMLLDHENPNNDSRAQVVTIRILLGAIGVSAMLNVVQGVALTELIPMHTVSPYLVTFSDKADQMVRIDPPTARISSLNIVLLNELKQYMMARYTVTADATETSDRWNTHVRLFSTQRVYQEFQDEVKDVTELMKRGQFTRQVTIVNLIPTGVGVFQCDFDTFDHMTGAGLSDSTDQTHHFTASLRVIMQPRSVPRELLDINPFGFLVTSYAVSPRYVKTP
jgi:type IV secretory pathway component VirB8